MPINFKVDKINKVITDEGTETTFHLLPQNNPKISPKDWTMTIKEDCVEAIFGELDQGDIITLEVSKKNRQTKIT